MYARILLAVIFAAMLTACSTTMSPLATLSQPFNAGDAAFINKQGTATISGQAFLRRNDGIVVYGAGSEVYLIPKTAYSDERMAAIYGTGKASSIGKQFANDDPAYHTYTRKVIANGEGRFTFQNVAAGSYYVVTNVVWFVQYQQGGALMERVTVSEGQTVELILNGQ